MSSLIEFYGRLSRSDKRPANPGRYDLQFQLHPGAEGNTSLWTETLKGVDVAPGGFYYVVLGQKIPFSGALFANLPRWLSVRVVTGGKRADEHSARVPLLGAGVALAEQVGGLDLRLEQLESALAGLDGGRNQDSTGNLRSWLQDLTERLETLEARLGGEGSPRMLAEVMTRLDKIDGEEGRLTRVEDELEDIVGPDGDVVDLNERMDVMEGRAPELIANLRAREGQSGRERLERLDQSLTALRDRVGDVDRAVDALRVALGELREAPPPTPEAIGALKRSGDTMSGGLTINRGGLEVVSGGITSRSAEVSTLEASNAVRTPKLVTDAVELRGDLTVDSPRRTLQVRLIEGRQGSAKKDGPLHLNTRSGGEVVVGNAEEHQGLAVHGSLRADAVVIEAPCLAAPFDGPGSLQPGELVRLDGPSRVVRASQAGDAQLIGVVASGPVALLGGERNGAVIVALQGITPCLAEADSGPIRAGDLLVSGATPGHAAASAEPAAGTILGRALDGLAAGRGTIRVLLGSR